MKFTEFDFDPKILQAVKDAGFEACTKVQAETFGHSLSGSDLCVQSQTGTGKTAAFLLTIFQQFLLDKTATKKALIVVPTRELALQIEEEAKKLGSGLPYSIASIFGGVGYSRQEQALKDGTNIIIGTPGRLIDFMKSGKLYIKDISFLVLDEADRMLDMGFYPDIREIIKRAPDTDKRQTMLFSATLRTKVKNLAWKFMNNPEEVLINPEKITVEEITQELYHVSNHEKVPVLLGILKREKPDNMLIFTNTKTGAINLSKRLRANGIDCHFIMGDLPQRKRTQVINDLKSGKIPFLVATDVAARGLHVDHLDLVINYDLPDDCENYVHRIGRTARAGKSGKAISLACEKYVFNLENIEKYINMKIPVAWADESLFTEDKSAGMQLSSRNQYSSQKPQHNRSGGRTSGRPGNRSGGRPPAHSASRSGGRPSSRSGSRSAPPPGRRDGGQGRNDRRRPDKPSNYPSGKTARPQHKESGNKPRSPANEGSVSRNKNIESRLEMYKRKYGEDFAITEKTPEKNKSFIKKIVNKLRKRKKK